MKSFLKKNIKLFVGIIVGIILSSGVVYAINANSITFNSRNENWDVDNIEDAINELYSMGTLEKTVLWTNSNPTSNFAEQNVTLSDNINNYRFICWKIKRNTTLESYFTTCSPMEYFENTPKKAGGFYMTVGGLDVANVNGAVYYRSIRRVVDSTIYNQLFIGSAKNGTNAVVSNASLIPIEIVGVK